MAPRLILLILDGAADRPVDGVTPLSEARTPGLDALAEHAVCGFHYPVAPGIAPESDLATLSLLGYEPEKYYTGRGPLEALGIGLSIKAGYEVAFRANFATIDPATRRIIDRRVGRSLGSEEARSLAAALDGMELGENGYALVRATVGHRAVVVIGSRESRLSAAVSNIDPAYVRKGLISEAVSSPEMILPRCKPLEDTEEARRTCRLVDEFVDKSIEILENHPVNAERARRGLLKANAMLLRDAGDRIPEMPPITSRFGFSSAASVAEMPVEIGIARAAGMRAYRVSPPSGDLARDLPERLEAAVKALEEGSQFLYVHLKGPDEPGHDGDFERKKNAIELIDEYFVRPLIERIDLDDVAVLVTSDHATPWSLRSHSGDPVPWMLSWRRLPGGPGEFNEIVCGKRGSKTLEHGWLLLPYVVDTIRRAQ
ncbi:phosphonopyruvate decarboxylase [Pyrodictium occultum]|uniref:Phosphonopyruvate decarboxylase n=1 Tax=Pyrodictium occultum TaxID=2309 RepID=A0A0V8RW43_PYROC|nr:alkaline phosphatase family protein [Pyrodictium occultum]KSW12259.1 phosphonopyruvate decarboxylase [Pyrodictium occultum]